MEKMNLLKSSKAELNFWEEKRKYFTETEAFHKCQKQLVEDGHLNIIGTSGSGKTSMAHELLRQSQKIVLILTEASQWTDVYFNDELIVLIEDIFGRLSLNNVMKEKWLRKANAMYSLVRQGKLKIITTCRENIYMSCENELKEYELFATANVYISRSDTDYCLTQQEKYKMLEKYIELSNPKIEVDKVDSSKVQTEWKISNSDIAEIVKVEITAVGFPQCCKAFVSDFECFKRGKDFFKRPFEVIGKILDIMHESKDENVKFDYCVLGCVLIYGQLTDQCIETIDNKESDEHKKVKELGEACGIKTFILSKDIRDAGNRLKTSYLIYTNNTFSFQHNSMLEAVFSSYFKKRAPMLIELCEWEVLKSLVSPKSCTTNKTVCVLPLHRYNLFSTRMITELTENSTDENIVANVFSHRVLTDTIFVDNFITNLTSDPTTSMINKVYYCYGRSQSILFWTCGSSSVEFLDCLVSKLRCLWSTDKLKEEFREGLRVACMRGNYNIYQYIITNTDTRPDGYCLYWAARMGNLTIFTDLITKHTPWNDSEIHKALLGACENGKHNIYQYIIKHTDTRPDGNCLVGACKFGKYDMYQYIITHTDTRPDGDCLYWAARMGHLPIFSDMITKHKPWDDSDIQNALRGACVGERYDVYQYIITHTDTRPGGRCLYWAARKGHLPWNDSEMHKALRGACVGGKHYMYQCITTHTDTRPDGDCLLKAAGRGSLQIVTDLKHKPSDSNIQNARSAACNVL